MKQSTVVVFITKQMLILKYNFQIQICKLVIDNQLYQPSKRRCTGAAESLQEGSNVLTYQFDSVRKQGVNAATIPRVNSGIAATMKHR